MLDQMRELWGRVSAAAGRAERWLAREDSSANRYEDTQQQTLLSQMQESGAGMVMRYDRHTRQSRLCDEMRVAKLMRRLEGATSEQIHRITFLLDTYTSLWNEAAWKPRSGHRYGYYVVSTGDGMREFHLWLIEQGALWNASRSGAAANLDRYDRVVDEVLGVSGADEKATSSADRVAA